MDNLFVYIKKHSIIILILIFFLTLPFKDSYNSVSIILLSIYGLFELFSDNKTQFQKIKFFHPFLLFYLLIVTSLFYSTDVKYALINLQRMLPFIVFPFIFSVIKIKRHEIIKLMKFYIAFMLLIAIFSHIKVVTKLISNNDRLYNIFNRDYSYMSLSTDTIGISASQYAYLILTAVILLTYLLIIENKIRKRILYIITLIYFSFFIFHLSTRIAIFTLFAFYNISILYYFSKQKKIKKGLLYLLLLYIVTVIIGYNVRVTRYRFQHIFGFTYSSGIHHEDGIEKIMQWKAAINANKNLFFGTGVGDANTEIYNSYLENGQLKNAQRKYNAHNQFIQTYVGIGIIGLLLLLYLFYFYSKIFFKKKSFIGLSFLFISFLLFSTESHLERHKGITIFSFIIGLTLNYLFNEGLKGNANNTNNHKKLY